MLLLLSVQLFACECAVLPLHPIPLLFLGFRPAGCLCLAKVSFVVPCVDRVEARWCLAVQYASHSNEIDGLSLGQMEKLFGQCLSSRCITLSPLGSWHLKLAFITSSHLFPVIIRWLLVHGES